MANANNNRGEAERLRQLDAIEDKLKRQKQHLKEIKESNMSAADKEKAIEKQVIKINQSLKEQIVLKKELNKERDKEITLVTKLEDYEKKISKIYKEGTPELREQMEAQGGILDQSEIIQSIAEKGVNLTGDQGDIYSEIAQTAIDIGSAAADNLKAEQDIGKEVFKQIDLKDKKARIQELENRLQNANFKDSAIGEDMARKQAEDALNFLKKQYADEEAQYKRREAEHKAINDLQEAGNQLMGEHQAELKKWWKALFSVGTLLATWIGGGLLLTKKRITEIGKEFGAVATLNHEFRNQIVQNTANVRELGKNIENVVQITKNLTKQWGFGYEETLKFQNSIADTASALALSDEEASNLIAGIKTITGLSMEQADAYAKQVTRLAEMNNAAPVDVLQDIANSSEVVAKFTDSTGENIAQAAIQAQKLGINLNTVGGIAESLLDFQSSIGKEVELSVLLGRQLNFQRARELALANDLKGMMDEVVKQLGSEEELLKMNAIQRKAIADMLGVSAVDLSKMVDNQGKQLTLAEGLLQSMGISDLVGKEALSSLDSLINSFITFTEVMTSTVLPAVEPFFMLLDATVGTVLRAANAMKYVLLPVLTALAVRQAYLNFQLAAGLSLKTVGFGIAAAIAGIATFQAFVGSAKPKSYATLPEGQGAFIQQGQAIADPGEAIVHQKNLGANQKEVVDAIGSLKGEMIAMKNALTSLELKTSVSNKDLNIVMTPKNA